MTPTLNGFDLIPRMPTELSLCSYRDKLAYLYYLAPSCARVNSWSMVYEETALFLLDCRFDYQLKSPLQNPGMDFSLKAIECDFPITGTYPFFKIVTTIPVCQSKGTNPDLHATL